MKNGGSQGEGGRVNVLFIEDSRGVSGSTMSLCRLLSHLDPRAYAAHVVFSQPAQATYWTNCDVPRVETAVIRRGVNLRGTRAARGLARLGGRIHPRIRRLVNRTVAAFDIIFETVPYCLRLLWWCRGRNIRLIHHNNGFYVALVLLRWMLGVPVIAYQRGQEWDSPAVRRLAQHVDHWVANSDATRRDLLGLGVPLERIEVVYPPVDLAAFHPDVECESQRRALGLRAGRPTFGIVGHLVEWKGQKVFLRAAGRVLEAVPEARALVIGAPQKGREGYELELHRLAQELGIADRVLFTGFREDVPQLMGLLDVVVHASTEPEPFGRVIVEAMAMGKPVIATDAGGPREIVEDEQTGILVPLGDDEILARRIVQLLTDPALAARIGACAGLHVRAHFGVERHAEMMQRAYARVLERQVPGQGGDRRESARVAEPARIGLGEAAERASGGETARRQA